MHDREQWSEFQGLPADEQRTYAWHEIATQIAVGFVLALLGGLALFA